MAVHVLPFDSPSDVLGLSDLDERNFKHVFNPIDGLSFSDIFVKNRVL